MHEVVPSVKIPWAAPDGKTAAVVVDGVLDEAVWSGAGVMGPLVNNMNGKPDVEGLIDGQKVQRELHKTVVRVLWDEEALYLGFEVEDDDIWARQAERDSINWRRDELIEIAIDHGDEITFYHFALSPLNVQYDAFVLIPEPPMDYDPWNRQLGLLHWDAHWQSAVRLDGTLDVVKKWKAAPLRDRDRGYTAEMAIPWVNFRTTTTPDGESVRQTVYPQVGERWRLEVFRVERPRVKAEVLADKKKYVDRETVLRLLAIDAQELDRLVKRGYLPLVGGDPNHIQLVQVQWRVALANEEWQSWAPTYSNMTHVPGRFGVIEFVKE